MRYHGLYQLGKNFFPLVKEKQNIFLLRYLLLFSHLVMSNTLQPHELQHVSLPCPSPFPRVCSNSCPLSQWCHPPSSSSAASFSPALNLSQDQGLFQSWLFTSGDQSTGASVSTTVLPRKIQGWFPLRLTGLISLCRKSKSQSNYQN